VNLKDFAVGRVLIIGVGNRERGDDGVGPLVIDALSAEGFTNVLDVGTVPENYTGTVIRYKPDTVLIIDALSFGGEPGNWKLITPEECTEFGFSTHTASLSLFASYIKQWIPVTIYVLGVQPKLVDFQADVSPDIKKSVSLLMNALKEIKRK